MDWIGLNDAIFAKHDVSLGAAKVALASLYEGGASQGCAGSSASPETGFAAELRFSKRPLDYYVRESTPWWKVALRHPQKVRHWLMLREFQIAKRRAR